MASACTRPLRHFGYPIHHSSRILYSGRLPYQTRCFSGSAARCSSQSASLPEGAWDTHIHVTDPSKYPPSSKGPYKVHSATLDQALEHAKHLSVPNLCFVQTSTYGTDNTWITDCLKEVRESNSTNQARGIIAIDPTDSRSVSSQALDAYHAAGVRGVRINLVSVNADPTPDELSKLLRQHADLIRPLKSWSLQLHVQLDLVPPILRAMDELSGPNGDLKLCLDHLAYPPLGTEGERWRHSGWNELLELLEHDAAFVKVSAPYRFSRSHLMARGELGHVGRDGQKDGWLAAEHAVKDVLAVRDGKAVVFASDWPHTRFEGLDVAKWKNNCVAWAGELGGQTRVDRLFRDNAKVLLDA